MLRTFAIALTLGTTLSLAQAETAPDAFVMTLSTEVIDAVKADKAIQAGDVSKIRTLVDTKVLPNVNLQRMVIKSVGQPWRSATPEQQKRLTEEFKTYLINTYSGALTQVRDQTVKLRPVRAGSSANEIVIGTDVVSKGEPIQLDYRLEKAGDSWKIYDFNVLGLWATDSFRSQFARDLSGGGVDALIARLSEKNKQVAGTKN
ncbi:MAG TPA: ABC transporter substrate-binding protein [Burkholderiaceae bacterium]|jgi:phospholipid transport system substrate-binding protein|nr:ABC transporter substrate-binding protein [Burkholderiaceae bacterium]